MIISIYTKKKLIWSFVIAIFLLIAGYFSNNMPLFTGEDLEKLAIMETLNNNLGFHRKVKNEPVKYINTSFDKTLIPCYETGDFPGAKPVLLGNTEITDRAKLIKLLELLKNVDYKYLIIDIKFAKGLESDSCFIDSITGNKVKFDDKLFSLINQLDRVVIATHHEIKLINTELEKKAALADYRATATATNFVRFEYFDSIPYIPMAVYNDLNKRRNLDTIACHYPFGKKSLKLFAYYTQGNWPCYNSLFLDFNIRGYNTIIGETGHPNITEVEYLNMSKDILEDKDPSSIVKNFKDHYVFIGNMTEDIHDTYAGPQPGCVILSQALNVLDQQKHVVSLVEIILLLFLYFFISLFILCGKNVLDIFKKSNYALLNFIIDTTSFTIILSIFHFVEYMFGRTSFSFVIPIITFTALKTFVLLRRKYNMKQFFLVVVIALMAGLLMSFSPEDKTRTIEIHSFNSDCIRVDGQELRPGMMISLNSKITFSHPKEYLKVINRGNTIKVNCKTHNLVEDWANGDYRRIEPSNVGKPFSLFWWITWHTTSTKGDGMFESIEYVIGDKRPFAIQDRLINYNEQFYKFIIIEGKYKGNSFVAYPDDTEPIIWITKEHFGKYLDGDSNTLTFKVEYHNYNETFTITDSVKIIFINL